MSVERAAVHYDRVTEAWSRWVMGESLHFGLFDSGRETLAEATHNLTLALAERAELAPGLEVLDVGCGTGAPAAYLAEAEGVRVTGISTSAVGIERARARAAASPARERLRFEQRDALASGLPDASFDRVFSLESAHLMDDRPRLFAELARVLKPGGRLALCDVVMVGGPEVELMQYAVLGHGSAAAAYMREAVAATMHRAFGSANLPRPEVYREAALAAGFVDVALEDVSEPARRTLARWSENAATHRDAIASAVGAAYAEDLFLALLHMSFGWGRLGGYVLMTARTPE